ARFINISQKLDETLREAYGWQEYFIQEQSLGNFEVNDDPASFGIGFDYAETVQAPESSGVKMSLYKQFVCTELIKLRLSAVRMGNTLDLQFYYDLSLYQADDIRRIAEEFATLLESTVNQPDIRIDELRFIGENESRQILLEW